MPDLQPQGGVFEPAADSAPQLAPPRRIVLTGFMGAGKTTVGLLLAKRLHWRFVDADEEIEATTGATIAQLFESRGEDWFRQVEHETVARLIATSSVVIALGGGAIEDARTRGLLFSTPTTRLIHLEASLETVLKRCQGTESVRPILRDPANLEARYRRRLPLYGKAHLTVPVDKLSAAAIAESILARLSQ